ncbi:hypothetical protein [Turicibacter bilis]|uniref:hypothetical protein n=1 Tax=Turicibacter bilis TaxID=2735723 RepID=UPI001BAFDF12|nr:hypothetical protein [Turicibacter bilis]MBS3199157.1 hypothetical protein [Turicibacter bilis]
MYKRYKLEHTSHLESLVKEYSSYGEVIMENRRSNIRKDLEHYINQQGYIDMSKISEDWFPTVNCDVFLSHSHKDDDLVKGLVGFFHKFFNIEVFVDSYIWGYCNDLLLELDNKYCRTDNSFFDYHKRNHSTAHVHMMLSNSLNKMINKTECIIFLETKNSLDAKNIIENGTSSPWIYSELIATKLIQITFPERIPQIEKRAQFQMLLEEFNPMYRGEVSHLEILTAKCLEYVASKKLQTKEQNLDEIYKNSSKS